MYANKDIVKAVNLMSEHYLLDDLSQGERSRYGLVMEEAKELCRKIDKMIYDYRVVRNEKHSVLFQGFEGLVEEGGVNPEVLRIVNDKKSLEVIAGEDFVLLCSLFEAYIERNRHLKKGWVPKDFDFEVFYNNLVDSHIELSDSLITLSWDVVDTGKELIKLLNEAADIVGQMNSDLEDWIQIAEDEDTSFFDYANAMSEIGKLI